MSLCCCGPAEVETWEDVGLIRSAHLGHVGDIWWPRIENVGRGARFELTNGVAFSPYVCIYHIFMHLFLYPINYSLPDVTPGRTLSGMVRYLLMSVAFSCLVYKATHSLSWCVCVCASASGCVCVRTDPCHPGHGVCWTILYSPANKTCILIQTMALWSSHTRTLVLRSSQTVLSHSHPPSNLLFTNQSWSQWCHLLLQHE